MTVARRQTPNYTSDAAASYKAKIDASLAVDARLAGWCAPHQVYSGSPNPDWAVELDAGFIWDGSTLTEVAAQTVTGFSAPAAGYVRIDRVVLDAVTGVASRVAGTAETVGSPTAVAPAIPAGKIPICQVSFTDAATAVLDSMITDERPFLTAPSAAPQLQAVVKLTDLGSSPPTATAIYNNLGTLTPSRSGAGDHTLTWATTLTNPFVDVICESDSTASPRICCHRSGSPTGTSARVLTSADSGVAGDPTSITLKIYGTP